MAPDYQKQYHNPISSAKRYITSVRFAKPTPNNPKQEWIETISSSSPHFERHIIHVGGLSGHLNITLPVPSEVVGYILLLDSHRLGQVSGEVDIKAFQHSQPVCD
jgi:hypothetical protein